MVIDENSEAPMRITCPACGARYAVEDGAIPPEGRAVQCTACNATWRAFPETLTGATSAAGVAASAPPPLRAAPLTAQDQATAQKQETAAQSATTQAALIASMEAPEAPARRGLGAFAAGFLATGLAAAAAVAVYTQHERIAQGAPSLAEPLAAYVAAVDAGRVALDEALR